jgi:microcystin degradation protein MlrC
MPRVLIARFMHETNTFSRVKTALRESADSGVSARRISMLFSAAS